MSDQTIREKLAENQREADRLIQEIKRRFVTQEPPLEPAHIQGAFGLEITSIGEGLQRARIHTLGYGEAIEMEAVEETEADAVAMLAQRIRDRIAVLGEMLEIVERVTL